MEADTQNCLICCNEIDIFGIGVDCAHEPYTCWKCVYIIQQYHKEKVCPSCKESLKTIKYCEPESLEGKDISEIEFMKEEINELKTPTEKNPEGTVEVS